MNIESPALPTGTTWHTVVPTALLGELTIVRDADAITGLYFPHHWNLRDRSGFGERREDGFGDAIAQLHQYLAGERTEFDLPLRAEGTAQQHRIWDRLGEIPYGTTTTYGELADESVTAQEVGQAVGRNPLSVFVACHRVLGRGGKLVGYAGGLARKRVLLDLERATCGQGSGLLW